MFHDEERWGMVDDDDPALLRALRAGHLRL